MKKVLVLFGCILFAGAMLVGAQQTDNQMPVTFPTVPESSSRPTSFLQKIFSPLRMSIHSARQLIHDGVQRTRKEAFLIFARLYNKNYTDQELPRRMALFFRRKSMIDESVKMFREGKLSFAMKENEFADWDDDELKKLTGVSLPPLDQLEEEEASGQMSNANTTPATYMEDDDKNNEINLSVKAERIPARKDWRTSGCVSTPINQMKCGACYAIATMSVVETMKCLNQASAPILSPQQIVDCATVRAGYSNYGCDGGWPTRVLKYLRDNDIVTRETCYPFVRRQQVCRLNQMHQVKGCTMQASSSPGRLIEYKVLHNEQDILYHVAKTGPVVTVMKATDKFLFYGPGIFDDPTCSNKRDDVDHAIVITGYGKENGVDYWLIKNSWGVAEWGEGGYAKYRRGKNACSIGHWGWVVTN